MTDNEIMKEQNFIDRITVFKERATDFFADYENPSGSEDRLEICLIRDGWRAVTQAEEIINRQQAEIERLQEKYDRTMTSLKAVLDERADHTEAIKEFVNSATDLCYKEFGSELEVAHTFVAILTRTLDSFEKEMGGEGK